MKITSQCVASLTWTLSDTLGEELDVLQEPVEFLVGGDDLFKVVEDALQGLSAGSTINLQIEPEQGFGEYNEQLVFLEPRAVFPCQHFQWAARMGGDLSKAQSVQILSEKPCVSQRLCDFLITSFQAQVFEETN